LDVGLAVDEAAVGKVAKKPLIDALCEEIVVLMKAQERKLLDSYLGVVRTGLSEIAWHVALIEERAMMSEQARHVENHQACCW
jgi:hypothetical protein